ncbi:MAG: shikimate dehydrogenase, partial [Bacillota bacterium]|nr:shikimate dehydrogenase [Bacillota bacterium]
VLLGNPVGHSLSPLMHNHAFRTLGLNWTYVPCLVEEEEIGSAISGLKGLSIKGANVTIPFKEKVIPFLDNLSDEAHIMKAVNTIVNKDGQLTGYNTDGMGFVRSLEELGVSPKGKSIAIIGTGGAAKGVAVALTYHQPKEIYIIYRSYEKAVALKETLAHSLANSIKLVSLASASELVSALTESQLLINTTPVGMYPKVDQEPIIKLKPKYRHLLVADLIYNPLETRLLQEAKKIGCQTLSGLGMFIHQGALAFELWTGHKAPIEAMKKTVLNSMALK